MPTPLPIDPLLPEIANAMSRGNLVVEAPPGAGKTTRVPPALLEVVAGDILVAQPRRLAARLAARRVATERGEPVGRTVGHQVRFDRLGGAATRIWFVTDGVLLRRLHGDPDLRGVGAVLLDEIHERSLAGDVALALLRRLQERRPELRLGAMSATLDAEPIAEFLDAPVVRATGRAFPVAVEHQPHPEQRPLEVQVRAALRPLLGEGERGDILVFLPGAAEILRTREALTPLASERSLELVILHGDQPAADQEHAIAPGPRRKVILSTNVAETSVTIEGVTAVIDSGLARIASHSPWTGLPTLKVATISQASAIQRAGRAGRVGPGRCLRLYTQHDFDSRPAQTPPEILRGDLAATALQLRAAGLPLDRLAWLDSPPAAAAAAAETLLGRLGAVAPDGAITAIGRRMAELPLHPRLARLLFEGERHGLLADAALAAALLGERDLRAHRLDERSKAAITARCDVGWAIDLVRARHPDPPIRRGVAATVRRVADRLERLGRQRAAPPADPEAALSRALLSAFPDRVAKRRRPGGSELVLSGGGAARQAEDSAVRDAELVVVVRADQRAGHTVAHQVSAIEPEWLLEDHADQLAEETEVCFVAETQRVEVVSRLRYDRLTLDESRRPPGAGEAERAAELLAEAALALPGGLADLVDRDKLESWRSRLDLVAESCPEANVSPVTDRQLRELLVAACRGESSLDAVRRAGLLEQIRRALPAGQRAAVEELAPSHITLRSGRRVAVHYQADQPPWIASRLQDFFGMTETPTLARGRVPLVLHLLAPNQRAVQVTTDLAGFWRNHYPALRRQLERRYPRHAWPDDPTTPQPTMRRKRRR